MVMFSSSRLAGLQPHTNAPKCAANPSNQRRRRGLLWAHLPWNSRLSSLQALMETSAELECLLIMSTTLTWRPLDSSRERILPAGNSKC